MNQHGNACLTTLDQPYHRFELLPTTSTQKISMKISEIQRQKAVRTIQFFCNQRQAQAIVDRTNNPSSKWFLVKTVQFTPCQQTNVM
jgi:hypothetical protein